MSKPPNVHYIGTNSEGKELYGLGYWVESAAQYQLPLDAETRKATGCHTEYAKVPMGSMTLEAAKKEARRVCGYAKVDER